MASLSNRLINILMIVFIAIISTILGLQTFYWVVMVNGNDTLRLIVPAVIFISSSLGLWVILNFLKVFILQQRGIKGYQLRGKISFYFLLVSLGSIALVGGLMFYLILLIEYNFLNPERGISELLMKNYNEMTDSKKLDFERETMNNVLTNPGEFSVIFRITNGEVEFVREQSGVLSGEVLKSEEKIVSYYSSTLRMRMTQMYYFGDNYEYTVFHYQRKGLFFVQHTPQYLYRSLSILRESTQSFNNLNKLKANIQPITIIALIVFSVPILIAVFFISQSFVRNITTNIEEIVTGTRIVADGNLNYQVKIRSRDEIGDLAANFNKMAQKLKVATEQIKRMERLEAWQEMAKRLAHEVKNPLTPIKLSAERLMYAYGKKTPEEFGVVLDKTVSTVIKETLRLETLVNEFSRFARLPYLTLVKQDIVKVLAETADFFRGAYKELTMETSFHKESLDVEFDVNQFKQVIINIITNAIEACADGNKYVKITTRENEDRVVISINDKSGGITAEVQGKMFEPYYTTKSTGTGLGLAIAERIVMEHGGNIWFETNSEGSTFYLELPLKHESGLFVKGGTSVEEQDTGSG